MKINRQHEGWMRYRAEWQIARQYPEVNGALRRNKWLDWLDRILRPEKWYISVGLTVALFIIVAAVINGLHLGFKFDLNDKKAPEFGKFIDDRASNLATITSMSMAVIGFLVSNIAIKELYAVKLLFKRTKLSFVIIFALTALAIFVFVSAYRYTDKIGETYNNIVLASAVMLVVVLVLIGYLFVRIIYFIDPAQIDGYINRELEVDALVLIREGLLQSLSNQAYRVVMRQAAVQPYNLSDGFGPETLKSIMRLINQEEVNANDEQKSYVLDLDLNSLRAYLHDHKGERMVFHNLYLGANTALTDNYVFVPGRENTVSDKTVLRKLLIKGPQYDKFSTADQIRKHHDEKLVALAEDGKHKELERVLEGLKKLYQKQFGYRLTQPFDVTAGLPALINEALRVTIKEQHYRCFLPLFEMTIQTSAEALIRLDMDIYRSLLFIYPDLYLQIYPHRAEEGYKEFFPLALQATASFEALLYELTHLKRRQPEKLPELNAMGYHTYGYLSELGYHILNKEDVARLKGLADVLDRDMFDQPDVDAQVQLYRLVNDPAAAEDELAKAKEHYDEAFALRTYRRHTLFGLHSWLIHLKREGCISDMQASVLNNLLRVDYQESRDALDDILNIRQGKFLQYFGWMAWRLPSQDPDEETEIEDSISWLSFGFFVQQIMHNQIQFFLSDKDLPAHNGLLEIWIGEMRKYKDELILDFEKWQGLLRAVDTTDELARRADTVIRVFERLAEKMALTDLQKIAEAPLDGALLDQFASQALETWKKEAHIWQLLNKKDAIVEPPEDSLLPFIGRKGFERDLKRIFLHYDQHNDVNILRPMVGQAGRQADTEFLQTIRHEAAPFRQGDLVDLIPEALKQLRGAAHMPDAIIVAASQAFANDKLMQHALFKQMPSTGTKSFEFKIGEFDGTPLYFTHSLAALDHVFVFDLKTALELHCLMADDLEGGFLRVNVSEVTVEEAAQVANKSAQASGKLGDADKIALSLRNGLRFTVGINAQLKIKNKEGLKVGKVSGINTGS